MAVPSGVKPSSSHTTSRSSQRLTNALSTLTSATPRAPHRVTASSLCRLAGVSRNTLYRYYPEMAEAVRRLRRRRGARRQATRQSTLLALRSELAMLRRQQGQLAALADHYHTAAQELRTLLARRERDLAALRALARPGLIRAPPARS